MNFNFDGKITRKIAKNDILLEILNASLDINVIFALIN